MLESPYVINSSSNLENALHGCAKQIVAWKDANQINEKWITCLHANIPERNTENRNYFGVTV